MYKKYTDYTKGIYKYKLFCDRFPLFIFDYFDKLFERISTIYEEEHNKTKAYLK